MAKRNFLSSMMSMQPDEIPDTPDKYVVPQYTKGNYQFNWLGFLVIATPLFVTLLGFALGVPFHLYHLGLIGGWSLAVGVIGITAGYHRLYSHQSYTAGPFMMKLTAFMAAGSLQGSIKWWARLHRIHHKYTDTDKDPYNAKRGFWFSHCGWMCIKMRYDLLGTVDTRDLDTNPVVIFQRQHFAEMAFIAGVLLPWLSCVLLFGDVWGGLFYAVALKTFLIHQISFFINSLAHTNWFGAKRNFDDEMTPHDSMIFAVLNLGEGYHNYHHSFAGDYRNGYRWYHTDPTKWYIYLCEKLGFCWDLQRPPRRVIDRAYRVTRIKQLQEELKALEEEEQADITAITEVWTRDEVERLVKEDGRKLIIVEDYVLDLDKPMSFTASKTHAGKKINWYDSHPGGKKFLDAYIGRDATEAMRGGVYKHSHGAQNYVPELRVAQLSKKTL